jgi:uncharacterized Tic20 family protein
MLVIMSATYEHPSLRLPVTPDQRERAEHWLQEAYADGRISEIEFDRRIGQALSATTRRELNEAFFGLVQVTAPSQALGVHPAYQPLVRPETKTQAERGVAAIAHFSTFLFWLVGPLLIFALTQPGGYARREAAKAFNFQLIAGAAAIGTGILAAITDWDILGWILGLMFIGWVVLTIVGGAKALQGEDWTNPMKHIVKAEPLSER